MIKMEISEPRSMKGYQFKVWLSRNKDTLKNLLIGVTALTTYFSTMSNPQWLQVVLTILVPGLVKLGIDALDYYSSEVVNFK